MKKSSGQRRRRRRLRSNRHQQEILSNHYDKSRIEKELDLLFGDDDDDDDDEELVVDTTITKTDDLSSHATPSSDAMVSTTSSPSSRSSRRGNNPRRLHLPLLCPYRRHGKRKSAVTSIFEDLDLIFNLDINPSRSDAYGFDFLSVMEEGNNEEQEEHLSFQSQSQTNLNLVDDDLKQINTRSLTMSSSSDGDKEGRKAKPKTHQTHQSPPPSYEHGGRETPRSKQYSESDMDGFSVVEQLPIPERKMVISYLPTQLADRPPETLMISMDANSMAPSLKSVSTCAKSHISYDESTAITSSINFFLNANKEELRNEGLSLAGGNDHISHSISPRSVLNNNLSEEDEESQTAIGHSRGSSKFTTDSPRILELREKKRLMERSHERKYNRFPALIEVDKFTF